LAVDIVRTLIGVPVAGPPLLGEVEGGDEELLLLPQPAAKRTTSIPSAIAFA
jgi:hypothetical protein